MIWVCEYDPMDQDKTVYHKFRDITQAGIWIANAESRPYKADDDTVTDAIVSLENDHVVEYLDRHYVLGLEPSVEDHTKENA